MAELKIGDRLPLPRQYDVDEQIARKSIHRYAALAHWRGAGGPATVVMPTGTGKTVTMLAISALAQLRRLETHGEESDAWLPLGPRNCKMRLPSAVGAGYWAPGFGRVTDYVLVESD
ncbi:hypothetical protein ACFFMP_18695 [Pseudoroseomonas cervicalis]|uniref:Helicase/UvrB N-terminal domain-containing protein n=2 Tax=Teichococcus cervicalis TaxID=204525 RepID=D5RQX1_9PROT|nr:hypothetical protein HMPREF0731_3483 [Pseudoroseomonas cervicalis ATCC 49957]